MRFPLAVLLTALFLSSCAPSLPYSADYPMTQTLFRSRDSSFSGRIPAGWFSSTDDSLAPALTAWLIREDYAASLTVRELKLDGLAEREVKENGLKLLATLNAALERHNQQMRDVKEFRFEGREYCGYEFGASESPGRAVVFSNANKFYACTAQRVNGSWSQSDFNALFRTQQSVLHSLSF